MLPTLKSISITLLFSEKKNLFQNKLRLNFVTDLYGLCVACNSGNTKSLNLVWYFRLFLLFSEKKKTYSTELCDWSLLFMRRLEFLFVCLEFWEHRVTYANWLFYVSRQTTCHAQNELFMFDMFDANIYVKIFFCLQ